MPFSQEGRPGTEDTEAAAEEERRHEEARLRAEAEAAALEQLKAENPEAYAKPVKPEEAAGDEAEVSTPADETPSDEETDSTDSSEESE
jgi:hypothetical protein